ADGLTLVLPKDATRLPVLAPDRRVDAPVVVERGDQSVAFTAVPNGVVRFSGEFEVHAAKVAGKPCHGCLSCRFCRRRQAWGRRRWLALNRSRLAASVGRCKGAEPEMEQADGRAVP